MYAYMRTYIHIHTCSLCVHASTRCSHSSLVHLLELVVALVDSLEHLRGANEFIWIAAHVFVRVDLKHGSFVPLADGVKPIVPLQVFPVSGLPLIHLSACGV